MCGIKSQSEHCRAREGLIGRKHVGSRRLNRGAATRGTWRTRAGFPTPSPSRHTTRGLAIAVMLCIRSVRRFGAQQYSLYRCMAIQELCRNTLQTPVTPQVPGTEITELQHPRADFLALDLLSRQARRSSNRGLPLAYYGSQRYLVPGPPYSVPEGPAMVCSYTHSCMPG